jgi:hypothetical protein
MANFQFGQDNVGGGWGVPSGYMQAMSASPTANALSGIANAIAAASQQYQAARQNAVMEGIRNRQLNIEQGRFESAGTLERKRIDLARDEYEYRKRKLEAEMNQQKIFGEAAVGLRDIFSSGASMREPQLPQQQQATPMSDSMQLFPPYGLPPANPQSNLGSPSLITPYGIY